MKKNNKIKKVSPARKEEKLPKIKNNNTQKNKSPGKDKKSTSNDRKSVASAKKSKRPLSKSKSPIKNNNLKQGKIKHN